MLETCDHTLQAWTQLTPDHIQPPAETHTIHRHFENLTQQTPSETIQPETDSHQLDAIRTHSEIEKLGTQPGIIRSLESPIQAETLLTQIRTSEIGTCHTRHPTQPGTETVISIPANTPAFTLDWNLQATTWILTCHLIDANSQ